MSDLSTSPQLLLQVSKENLYPKLIAQLNKDFSLSGLEEVFYLESNPEELLNYLNRIINDLIRNQFSDYLNLLYRVDVSEAQLKKIENTDVEQMSNQVSFLILKRECQKILIRNRF